MADNDITFETWTLPSTGSFTQKGEITRQVSSYSLTEKWSAVNDGQMVLDQTNLNLDDIIKSDTADHSNDEGSVIRVNRDGTPALHYVATDFRKPLNSTSPYIPLTVQGMEWFLDRAMIKRFDWTGTFDVSYDPDWIYGAASILKPISGETTNELQEIWVNATAGTYTITDGTDTTDPIDFDASAGVIATRLETDITAINDVSVTGTGALKTPYEIEFNDPTSFAQLTIGTNSTNGAISVSTTREGGALDERPWHKSYHPVTGVEHGNYQTFQIGYSVVNSALGSTYSLEVDLDSVRWPSDYGGAQQIVSVRPGSLYRAGIWVNPGTTDKDVRLVIRDLSENLIAKSDDLTIPANTWTYVETQGPQFYTPDNVTEVIFRLGILETTNIDKVYIDIDNALLAPGKPAATIGFILNDLLGPINDRNVLDWLNPTWTNVGDSTSSAWDQDVSLTITRGQSILQFLEFLKKTYGYEWDIQWNTGTSQFDWHMYNPDGGGTAQDVTITGKGDVIDSAPIVRRITDFNHAEAEGSDGQWSESNNPANQGALGRLERYFGNRQGNNWEQLQGVASQLISDAIRNMDGYRVKLQDPNKKPLTDYYAGDYVNLNMDPDVNVQAVRVQQITLALQPGDSTPSYDVHLNSVVTDPETNVASTVRNLVRRFDGLERAAPSSNLLASLDPSLFASPQSVPVWPYLVAASDSTQQWKDVAAYTCNGDNDQVEIQAAFDDAGAGETVFLAPGNYSVVVPTGDSAITMPTRSTLQGLGGGATFGSEVRIATANTSDPGAGSFVVEMGFYCNIEQVDIDATNGYTTIPIRTQFAGTVSRCNIYSDYIGIDMYRSTYVQIDRCLISMGFANPDVSPACIRLQDANCYYWQITNSLFNSGGRGIWIPTSVTSARNFRIQDNLFLDQGYQAIYLEGSKAEKSVVDGNIMLEMGQWGLVDYGGIQVEATTVAGLVVSNNIIDGLNGSVVGNGIWLNGAGDSILVHDNYIRYAGDGIRLDDVSECTVIDNRIDGPNNSSGHDGIKLTGTGNFNRIEGNRIWEGASFKWDNGIRVDSGMVDTIVVRNDLRDLTNTPISDAGAGTLLSFPNHITYGDNFTVVGGGGPSGGGGLPSGVDVAVTLPTPIISGDVGRTMLPEPVTVTIGLPQVTAVGLTSYDKITYPQPTTLDITLPQVTVTVT